MPFQMGYSSEDLKGLPPMPPGWYSFQFRGFKQKASKKKEGETTPSSYNHFAQFEVINNTLGFDGRKMQGVFNSKLAAMIFDWVHSTGLPMEEIQDGNQGTEAAIWCLPGVWEDSDKFPEEPEKWKYLGPLLNRTFEAEITITDDPKYGKRNDFVQFKCTVPNCQEKHRTNWILTKG